jgi:glycosyltransferase involved in cell wall biosynthesis
VKILLIHNRYRSGTPGGEDIAVDQEISMLQQFGCEVILYQRSNDEVANGGVISKFSALTGVSGSSRTRRDLRRLIRQSRPDLAHVHNLFPLISVSAIDECRAEGIPLVQTLHNYRLVCINGLHFRESNVCRLCSSTSTWPAVRNRCYRNSVFASLLLARAVKNIWSLERYPAAISKFIVLHDFVRAWLSELGVQRHQISIQPNFVDVPIAEKMIKKDVSSERYAVFTGRLAPEKGLNTLMRAWKKLNNLPLRIIGDGPMREEIEARIRDEALNAKCLGMLPRSAVLEQVAGAAFQVFPSEWYEGMPLSILEAWACQTPVIGSKVPGVEALLSEGRGLMFSSGDVDGLVSQAHRLLSSPEYGSAIARNAFECYRSRHTREAVWRERIALYRAVVSR